MVKNINKKSITLFLSFVMLFAIGFLVANNNKEFMTVAYAEEVVSTPTEQGACGTSATWEYYKDTATLEIKGSGEITTYNYGTAPWSTYSWNIKKIIVADTITSISKGAFYGLNNLQEITLPFVGQSRTATYETAVFGYIFGYTTKNGGGSYVFQGTTHSYVGYGSSYAYRSSLSKEFVDYVIGTDKYASSIIKPPIGTTLQYSCHDSYSYGDYYLQSYYYYIPSAITKVTVTDTSKIDAGAFFGVAGG